MKLLVLHPHTTKAVTRWVAAAAHACRALTAEHGKGCDMIMLGVSFNTAGIGRSLAGTTWRNLQRILKKNEVRP